MEGLFPYEFYFSKAKMKQLKSQLYSCHRSCEKLTGKLQNFIINWGMKQEM